MLEKVTEVAERAATNVSRRGFLGRLGRGAAATAAVLGGLLALPTITQAGKKVRICSQESGSACAGLLVGSACLSYTTNGKCQFFKGTDICTCRTKGRKSGGEAGRVE